MTQNTENKLNIKVYKNYAKSVVHMRRQQQRGQFGLVLGAGVSKPLNIPTWNNLLSELARHPAISGKPVDRVDSSATTRAEMLFRHFAERFRASDDAKNLTSGHAVDRRIKGEWLEIIRTILYKHIPDRRAIDQKHPYMGEYLDIVKNSPLTVTYNFDSCLEMMLLARQKRNKDVERYYETVFDGSLPFRSKTGIIYHPNGYLPDNILDGFSDDIVFSEQSFGDQLLDSTTGRHFSFAHHLSKNTCLFIGISFDDENLRHLLRRGATNNPGHYHYCIQWRDKSKRRNEKYDKTLAEYRFEVYNLITLFLCDEEIGALGRLLNLDFASLKSVAEQAGIGFSWVYYLTGIPGIGKTSLVRYMQGLMTYDEWPEEPHAALAKPYTALTPEEGRELDNWVAHQFHIKNDKLNREKEGVFLIDRAPLDPITFEDPKDMSDKAVRYEEILRGSAATCDLQPGEVLLLTGDTDEIATRLYLRGEMGRRSSPAYLKSLQEKLRSVYSVSGVREQNTNNLTLLELVKQIARLVHREDYREANLSLLLQTIKDGNSLCQKGSTKTAKGRASISRHPSSTRRSGNSTKSSKRN